MNALEHAILRTVLYADVFDFPLTVAEIHHFLIHDEMVSREEVERTLRDSAVLVQYLGIGAAFIGSVERPELVELRQGRKRASAALWPPALRYGQWLARIPFVRMVALTGALAMHNAREGDDLDYLIVTQNGRVWLARLIAVVLVRWVKRSGFVICPNYVLAENALAQTRRDLFIAHEVAQMIPLFGHAVYDEMRRVNQWSDGFLPNATAAYYSVEPRSLGAGWLLLKRAGELLLGGVVGNWLEGWEHRRKLRRFRREKAIDGVEARLDRTQVKGHFDDFGARVLKQYDTRMQRVTLVDVPAAGD